MWQRAQKGAEFSISLLRHHGADVVEGDPVVAEGALPYAEEADVSDDGDDEAWGGRHDGAPRQEARLVRYGKAEYRGHRRKVDDDEEDEGPVVERLRIIGIVKWAPFQEFVSNQSTMQCY